ncbi:flagellin N-terminal helical domain-containing protein [Virgibacillus halodenitrificans]|uniref:flagellin N-terminal helical domain-containing protein n=1 Tax=Virgibacillus halodenitrificans TaxID=1482 RepID=UPI002DBC36F7|nr:flagellin [Virgibacillus halodenitrificans]MEC2159731.1 flagellin [Virgibacillus halodenitrificans]
MRINHNIAALNTYRQLNSASSAQSNSMEKLSSGLRINNAADDAAGLAISEKMRGQIRGLDQASANAQDGISMIQTAEGALNETHDILQRMRELSTQASNDTNTLDDRKEIQKEVEQLKSEIDRISETTEFNTQKLLNGSLGVSGSSTDSDVVGITSATGLKQGDYEVTIDTAATKAAASTGTLDLASGTVDVSGKELVINGTKIDFSGMTSVSGAEVASKINEYKDVTGVEASIDSGTGAQELIQLNQTAFGSTNKITTGGADAGEFGAASGAAGQDAVVTIEGPDGATQQVTGLGQNVGFKGAEFVAKGNAADSETITVAGGGATLQIGANKGQNMTVDINEISSNTLGDRANNDLVKDVNVTTQEGADEAIKVLDEAIQQVSGERSKLGSFQNRLDHTINNLSTSSENLTAAESRIRDVDYALAA